MKSKITAKDKLRLKIMAQYAIGAKNVLDVGLHFPNFDLIKNKPKNGSIIGFDIIKIKKPEGYDKIILGDVQKLEKHFKANSLDAILLGEVLEHLENPYQAMASCYQALKKNGLLVISTPNPLGFPRIFWELFNSEKRFYDPEHALLFAPRWVFRMAQRRNFKLVEAKGLAFVLPIRVPLFLADLIIYVFKK